MRRFLFISLHFIGKGFGINKNLRNLTEAVFKITTNLTSFVESFSGSCKTIKDESHSQ